MSGDSPNPPSYDHDLLARLNALRKTDITLDHPTYLTPHMTSRSSCSANKTLDLFFLSQSLKKHQKSIFPLGYGLSAMILIENALP